MGVKNVGKLPSIRRMPAYLHIVREMKKKGRPVVSSAHLATDLGLDQVLVKKDLELLGIKGKTGVGYAVEALEERIEDFLGWNNTTEAFLVGAGNLGSALLGYEGFSRYGLKIVAAFDSDPAKVGQSTRGIQVLPMEKLSSLAMRMHVKLVVLAVPAAHAQTVTDMLIDSGIEGIWNFTPTVLRVPPTVLVQQEDLASGLAELSVKIQNHMKNRDA